MNLSLHDPVVITADYPSKLTTSLSYGHSCALAISPCGHYIASGLLDGTVLIIDSWTHNVISILRGHQRPVIGLKWIYSESQNLKASLVSWAKDWKVIRWCLDTQDPLSINKYVGGVNSVEVIEINCEIKSDNDWLTLVCANDGLHIIKDGESKLVEDNSDEENRGSGNLIHSKSFESFIIVGTSKGWICIIDPFKGVILKWIKVCTGLKGFDLMEDRIVVNSSDRVIRQYNIQQWKSLPIEQWSLKLEHKYQDVVNQVQWYTVKIDSTGEYLCATTQSSGGSNHDLYIWETGMGSLVQILEGPQEELFDVDWCGRRCEIIANGYDTGTIYLWGVQIDPKWSALAPDFEEIEQNVQYQEKEDEFDFLGEVEKGEVEDDEMIVVDVKNRELKDARGYKFIKGVKINVDLS
ncbi:COMPASS subunit protein [Martiniozyma asiatica (nom. inval.)]|nr:COMPASS subunit protein [Martiniozyma asiatica]